MSRRQPTRTEPRPVQDRLEVGAVVDLDNRKRMTSVLDYPDRGPWGERSYAGTWSGYLVLDLLATYRPGSVLEMYAGSGTTRDVCRDVGYTSDTTSFLDLRPEFGGFDAVADDLPRGAELVLCHPPYWDILPYSGRAWGTEPDPADLSRVGDYDQFIGLLDHVNNKLFDAVRPGGRLAILVGDIRRRGVTYSMQRDMRWPGTLDLHAIKVGLRM